MWQAVAATWGKRVGGAAMKSSCDSTTVDRETEGTNLFRSRDVGALCTGAQRHSWPKFKSCMRDRSTQESATDIWWQTHLKMVPSCNAQIQDGKSSPSQWTWSGPCTSPQSTSSVSRALGSTCTPAAMDDVRESKD